MAVSFKRTSKMWISFNYFILSTFPPPTKTNKTTGKRKRNRKLLLHVLHYHFALKYVMFGKKEYPRSFLISLSWLKMYIWTTSEKKMITLVTECSFLPFLWSWKTAHPVLCKLQCQEIKKSFVVLLLSTHLNNVGFCFLLHQCIMVHFLWQAVKMIFNKSFSQFFKFKFITGIMHHYSNCFYFVDWCSNPEFPYCFLEFAIDDIKLEYSAIRISCNIWFSSSLCKEQF